MLAQGSSPLHILDPSGFQISLLKSIVSNDAYLPRLVIISHQHVSNTIEQLQQIAVYEQYTIQLC